MKRSEILFGVARVPLDAFCAVLAFLLAYQLRLHNVNLLPWVAIKDATDKLPPAGEYVIAFALPGSRRRMSSTNRRASLMFRW